MPIPLRYLRSVEMFGKSGFQGEVKVHGEAPVLLWLVRIIWGKTKYQISSNVF